MELEELKAGWNSVNNRLDDVLVVQNALKKAVLSGQTKSSTSRLKIGPICELVVGSLTVLLSGGFMADNFAKILRAPTSAIPFGLLYGLGIFTIWLSIRLLIMVSGLDYAEPIVDTQRKIAALRSLRVRATQFMMLMGLPLWIIFPLVAGQAIFGFEFVQAVDKPWVFANVLFGVVVSAAIILAARRFGGQSRVWKKIDDALAGREIVRAQELLADIEVLAKE